MDKRNINRFSRAIFSTPNAVIIGATVILSAIFSKAGRLAIPVIVMGVILLFFQFYIALFLKVAQILMKTAWI